MDRDELPLSWKKALMAITPGFFATVGLVSTDFSVWMWVGLILLVTFQVIIFWSSNKRLPSWGLMATGMLASVGLMIASGVIGGLASIVVGKSANTVVLLILVITLIIFLGFSMRHQYLPLSAWALFASIILCQLAVRLKYFVLFGASWSVVGQWLNISLYAAFVGLLLPVVLGQFLAKRHGPITILFVIGMIYVNFQLLIDVNYKVSDHLGGTLAFTGYKALIPLLYAVIAPLWFLRARSALNRVSGMLTLVGLAVILDLLVVGVSYAGELPLIIWISFIPYTLSVLLTLGLAYLLYRERGNGLTKPAVAQGKRR